MTVSAFSSGNLRVPASFLLDISRGLTRGLDVFHRFGRNPDVGAVEEDIWSPGGTYPWPTTAETLRVRAGGNPADTAAGAGARSVVIRYLDENWDVQEETLATAGAAASAPTVGTARRVLRVYAGTAGTYTGANTGNIDIENTTSAQLLARIQTGRGQSQLSQYTVPANFTAYLTRIDFHAATGKPSDIRMWQRQNAQIVAAPFQAKRLVYEADGEGELLEDLKEYTQFPEMTDLWCSASTTGGGGVVSVTYDLYLVDNRIFPNLPAPP